MILRCPVCKNFFDSKPGDEIQLWCDDCRSPQPIADVIPIGRQS